MADKKTYVLDTSVLIQDPNAMFSFEDNHIIIADATIGELDRIKLEKSDRGRSARAVVRNLKKLREKGNLADGISLDNGGTLKIEMNCTSVELPESWDNSCDNRILRVCKGHNRPMKKGVLPEKAILVTQDGLMMIKADMIGVEAQSYISDQVMEYSKQYTGRRAIYCTDEGFKDLYSLKRYKKKKLTDEWIRANLFVYNENETEYLLADSFEINEFLEIRKASNEKEVFLAYFDGYSVCALEYADAHPYGITPRNIGQVFFQEALMRSVDEASLVICKGPAGTAKTLYSLAVALNKMLECDPEEREYRKVLVCRPNVKMDEDIGFLPGDEQEKIAPYLRPVMDNLEILAHTNRDTSKGETTIQTLIDLAHISFEAIAFIRGRSIAQNWLIIDEAQNLTPAQAKGIVTRAGEGAKIILIGDPEQIDREYLDERTNGLSYAAEKMKGVDICWQVTMNSHECERSKLARIASERM